MLQALARGVLSFVVCSLLDGWQADLKKLLLGVVLGIFGWQAYSQRKEPPVPAHTYVREDLLTEAPADPDEDEEAFPASDARSFSCDGRTTCSQITSCAEAGYFLKNCPEVEMDGNRDGEPCERQWCGNGS